MLVVVTVWSNPLKKIGLNFSLNSPLPSNTEISKNAFFRVLHQKLETIIPRPSFLFQNHRYWAAVFRKPFCFFLKWDTIEMNSVELLFAYGGHVFCFWYITNVSIRTVKLEIQKLVFRVNVSILKWISPLFPSVRKNNPPIYGQPFFIFTRITRF